MRGNDCASTQHAALLQIGAIQEDGSHADVALILNGASSQQTAMTCGQENCIREKHSTIPTRRGNDTDGDIVPNDCGAIVIRTKRDKALVNDRAILYVRVRANTNQPIVP